VRWDDKYARREELLGDPFSLAAEVGVGGGLRRLAIVTSELVGYPTKIAPGRQILS
jgi:hypothetical protein